ncbi:RNA polymerase sigma factor SigJ [Dokdonella fugitiva]|uniref:RNA polymerase sigma-70 factor (ECF subfamily) n=1 Tax=Dokdonella fugitiva TaxID=328517 RepID=A0A4V2S2F5_9GAMM|nr:RNA polymerase sigma factor SigJ [Dokdonella fugitiva]MBA8883263.1 RNA polymerase sigma-70 factor (ECF subfamily) [Dokdonella fugitiva]TCO40280.1 RNA polymerase sigma-70 factor (ECF subfamily) [Dokdonella fugitiva]
MEDAIQIFSRLQPRMLGAAYRMLGSLAEAEDVVQDVWARWHGTDIDQIDNAEAWLVATTTRRAIDRLRQARAEREKYIGLWLPEPVLTPDATTPEQLLETSSDLSFAFLMVLERLAPEARAAFLLHEVLDVDYDEIARVLEKSEATCRQIVHRARNQLRGERVRYSVTPQAHERLMRRFVDAIAAGDLRAMKDMLAESVELRSDGGGLVQTVKTQPLVGDRRIAGLLFAPTLRPSMRMRVELATINGHAGVLRYLHGELESAQFYESDGERIIRLYVQRNPRKLRRLAAREVIALR